MEEEISLGLKPSSSSNWNIQTKKILQKCDYMPTNVKWMLLMYKRVSQIWIVSRLSQQNEGDA